MTDSERRLPIGRAQLTRVVRAAGDTIGIGDAEQTLSVSRLEASKLLSRWTRQGWLKRVGPGTYVHVPIDSLESEHVLADPWILVPALFGRAYIGGWSAAEHWDLTEQLFRDTIVMTTQNVRARRQLVHGTTFLLRHIHDHHFFGTTNVWRERSKIAVSDVHRTIVDMFSDPALGGGIQHVSDCLGAYLKRKDRDDEKLVAYAERLGNGAVFKRLGYVAEKAEQSESLVTLCHARLSKGHTKLDPSLDGQRLVTRWRLRIHDGWGTNPP